MERIKELNGYQKGILVIMAVMVLVFTILYPVITSRKGYAYKDTILVQTQEGDNTVYTGKVHGVPSRFTVTPDKTVEFQYGEEKYGPYSIRVASSAAPKGADIPEGIVGMELLRGDEVLFRGGVVDVGNGYLVFNEDGSMVSDMGVNVGVYTNGDSYVLGSMEPSVTNVLDLLEGPELTHKGTWIGWAAGVFCCVVTALTILFADELFRFQLIFSIRNVEDAEPSEWEMMGRYIAWTVIPIMALVVFIMGLQ